MTDRNDKANRIAKHWIGGNWRDSAEHRDSINPATGEIIGRYAVAGREETAEAVAVALKVFRETDWKAHPARRSRVLNEMADRFEGRATDLIQLLSAENGKVAAEATLEVSIVPATLRYSAALVLTDHGRAAER